MKESFPQLVRNRANPSIWKLLPKRKPKDLNEFNSPTTVLLLSRIHLFSFTRKGLLNSIKKILLFLRHNLCSYKCYRKAKKKSRSIPKRCKPTKLRAQNFLPSAEEQKKIAVSKSREVKKKVDDKVATWKWLLANGAFHFWNRYEENSTPNKRFFLVFSLEKRNAPLHWKSRTGSWFETEQAAEELNKKSQEKK